MPQTNKSSIGIAVKLHLRDNVIHATFSKKDEKERNRQTSEDCWKLEGIQTFVSQKVVSH